MLPLLHSISPGLAALHTNRAQRINPDSVSFDDTHCSRCGFFVLDGRSCTRIVSKSKKTQTRQRSLQRTCSNCGFISRFAIDRGNAGLFPKRIQGVEVKATVPAPIAPSVIQIVAPVVSSTDPPVVKPKIRKKKAGLQEMLARNRSRQADEQSPGSGLASFLGNL